MTVNEDECEAAGLDPKRVAAIARRIERAALDARALGLQVFGGSDGTLRFDDGSEDGKLILASMAGNWSGGCGADTVVAGLIRVSGKIG